MTTQQDRYERGLLKLGEVGREDVKRVIGYLRDVAPDFACYPVEFLLGDIYSPPTLDSRLRETAIVAAPIFLQMPLFKST